MQAKGKEGSEAQEQFPLESSANQQEFYVQLASRQRSSSVCTNQGQDSLFDVAFRRKCTASGPHDLVCSRASLDSLTNGEELSFSDQ